MQMIKVKNMWQVWLENDSSSGLLCSLTKWGVHWFQLLIRELFYTLQLVF